MPPSFPIVDLFAGPGGLGEGFSSFQHGSTNPFRVALSVEASEPAHQTLLLRSFFRQFPRTRVPDDYYRVLRQELTAADLFERYPSEAAEARRCAWHATLGAAELAPAELDRRVREAIGSNSTWVLVGGPPCQAYSIAGRSRNAGKVGYRPEDDHRHFLYREYLRILGRYWPTVFIMENVKGVLSAKVGGEPIFGKILEDLQDPARALGSASSYLRYRIYSLSRDTAGFDLFGAPEHGASDYLVDCEKYGIPQARQRVLLLGVLSPVRADPQVLIPSLDSPTVHDALSDLPRLRGGLSRVEDSDAAWKSSVQEILRAPWLRRGRKGELADVLELVEKTATGLRTPRLGRGGEFVSGRAAATPVLAPDWFGDERIGGWCNHATRSHMASDLHRYLFAASFAGVRGDSPLMGDFPKDLLPAHNNVGTALKTDNFADRFKVQLRSHPSSTIMSHISKDGHYYIHYDPTQCRSLTVREAARLQTFPDNYYFCGERTHQYIQVGNAVPPLLARQVAGTVHALLQRSALQSAEVASDSDPQPARRSSQRIS